jgi:hypothetical protein
MTINISAYLKFLGTYVGIFRGYRQIEEEKMSILRTNSILK